MTRGGRFLKQEPESIFEFLSFRLDFVKLYGLGQLKRIISIVFISVVVLNTMGYYGVFLGLHFKNDLAMSKALDGELYDLSTAITLNVAVSIPYMQDQSDFERVNGKFEHNGDLYRLVKQKYARDTLTVVCVKDREHKKIEGALTDYVKTFSDKATDASSAAKTTVSFIKDYLPISFEINSATEGWALRVQHRAHPQILIPTFSASIIHPPERA